MNERWERRASIVAAFVVLGLVVFLVVRNEPFRDANLVVLTRVILSLAVAVFGATVPGFMNIEWNWTGLTVRAGGALALFLLTFVFTPRVFGTLDEHRSQFDQGVLNFNLGHYSDAVAHLSKIPTTSPSYREAISLKGSALFQLGRYSDAITAFAAAVEQSRNEHEKLQANYNIGLSYLYAKNYNAAKEILVPLANRQEMKGDPAVTYNAAAVQNLLGDMTSAKEILSVFPFSAPLPHDASSRDIIAKAYWLSASLNSKGSVPDCQKIKSELSLALSISPHLKQSIEEPPNPLDICNNKEERR